MDWDEMYSGKVGPEKTSEAKNTVTHHASAGDRASARICVRAARPGCLLERICPASLVLRKVAVYRDVLRKVRKGGSETIERRSEW